MISTHSRTSAFGRGYGSAGTKSRGRPGSKDGEKKAIWVPMLNNASKGKDLAEKQLIVLGGTPDQQREFLESLSPEVNGSAYSNNRRKPKAPPISNRYALGYTYQDVLDADQEDTLARLSIWMLCTPAPSFAPLLKPLLTPKTVPNTLVAILLDWSDPFKWPRQLRQWIRLLRSVILSLDEETKIAMEENMTAWKERRTGPDAPNARPGGGSTAGVGSETKQIPIVPLGPGEWDEGLGVPLSVVCMNANKIERMEREFGWQEEQFDFVLQWMRCVLLKHGGSLIYTASFDPNGVRTLIHSSLSIHSLLKREVVKHNVIERDKILVPPNWDSWGKIRILREGFELETVGEAWSVEIQSQPEELTALDPKTRDAAKRESETDGAVAMFETTFPDPALDRSSFRPITDLEAEVTAPDTQTFLSQQAAILEQLRADDDRAGRKARKGAPAPTGGAHGDIEDNRAGGVANVQMAEHIGPYQINVGGIQVDAEEVTRRMREREASRSTSRMASPTKGGSATPVGGEAGDEKGSNEAYKDFFTNLMKKGKGGAAGDLSPRASPRSSSRATER